MDQERPLIDRETLDRIEERLNRGIPEWERAYFIELIVPQLLKKLRNYMRFDP